MKTLWKLGNWFSINSILSDCKNTEKQKKLSALFGFIFKYINICEFRLILLDCITFVFDISVGNANLVFMLLLKIFSGTKIQVGFKACENTHLSKNIDY